VVISVVFEYEVLPETRAEFERVYGPEGEWARFFRSADGYVGTELHSPVEAPAGDRPGARGEGPEAGARFLVVDRWTSEQAYAAFLAAHAPEYERRSRDTAPLYRRETRIGVFAAAGPAVLVELDVLPGVFAVCRLDPGADTPREFWSVTRTADELSVICAEEAIPEGARAERGWRALRVAGPLDFVLTGVAAALTTPLAAAGISVLPVATFDTDYLFVREESLASALSALTAAGHTVH
jgi:uncharacterized protein